MKNIFKKALSFFLAVIMTVGMFPVTAMADGETDTGEYVYLSVSHDDKFIETADRSFAAHIPVPLEELQAINLDDYHLTEFRYDDKITVLHLFVYAQEAIFGGSWNDVTVTGSSGSIYFPSGLSGFAPKKSKIVAKYVNINTSKISEKEWTESSFFVNYFIKSNSVGTGEFAIEAGSEADFQTYKIRVKRTPTFSKLSVTDKNGGKVKITPSSFKADVTEYTATTAFDEITIDTTPTVKDAGYVVTYNGSESNVVALAECKNKWSLWQNFKNRFVKFIY